MKYWWNMLGAIGVADAYFAERHRACPFSAILKRQSLQTDVLLYAIANGYPRQ